MSYSLWIGARFTSAITILIYPPKLIALGVLRISNISSITFQLQSLRPATISLNLLIIYCLLLLFQPNGPYQACTYKQAKSDGKNKQRHEYLGFIQIIDRFPQAGK